MAADLRCENCHRSAPAETWNREQGVRCPGCGQTVLVAVFPAFARAASGTLPEALAEETEASCFYHPRNRAAVPCDECGRFLCHLCDLEVEGRHLCPSCLQAGVTKKKVTAFENRRVMHDTLALALATWPVVLIWVVVVTAPMALYIAIRHWRSPLSIVPRTRVRFVLAMLFALVELGGFAALIVALIRFAPSAR